MKLEDLQSRDVKLNFFYAANRYAIENPEMSVFDLEMVAVNPSSGIVIRLSGFASLPDIFKLNAEDEERLFAFLMCRQLARTALGKGEPGVNSVPF